MLATNIISPLSKSAQAIAAHPNLFNPSKAQWQGRTIHCTNYLIHDQRKRAFNVDIIGVGCGMLISSLLVPSLSAEDAIIRKGNIRAGFAIIAVGCLIN